MNSELLAALVGGSIALFAALGSQIVSWHLRRADRRASDRASRLATYLAATHGVVISVGRIAKAPMVSKREFVEAPTYLAREDAVNTQLNAIKLLDSADLVALVMELDQCLIQLRRDALEREWDDSGWIARREEVMRDVVERVVNAARKQGRELPIDLERISNDVLRRVPKAPIDDVQ